MNDIRKFKNKVEKRLAKYKKAMEEAKDKLAFNRAEIQYNYYYQISMDIPLFIPPSQKEIKERDGK